MHSIGADYLADGPDSGAESSFPERHLDDDSPSCSGIGSDRYQPAVTKRHLFEPGPAVLSAQHCPSNHGFLRTENRPHAHHLPAGSEYLSTSFPPPAAALRPEWSGLSQQSGRLFWRTAHSDFAVEDDSDSIQSPDNLCRPLSMLSSTQRPRRWSTRGVSKPTRTPAPASHNHPIPRTERPYIQDFDYNADWLDPLSPAAALVDSFVPHPPSGSPANRTEIDVGTRDSSSSSKVDSKRIAHKLSEKSRRNRLTVAIREIQKLLPDCDDSPQSPSRSHEADFVIRPGVPSSKLDVVEMAVGFIKDLKAKNTAMSKRLKEMEEHLGKCHDQRAGGDAKAASGPSATEDAALERQAV